MQIIRAIFEDGVFKPIDPVEIQPHQQVTLQVEDQDAGQSDIVQLNSSWSFSMSGDAVHSNGRVHSEAGASNGSGEDRRMRSPLDLSPNLAPGESVTRRSSIWDQGNGRNNRVILPSESSGKQVDSMPVENMSTGDASIWDEPVLPKRNSLPAFDDPDAGRADSRSVWD